MAEAERLFGPLPPTWSSGSRDDGSGIWWYRVPAGTHLVSEIAFPELGIRHVDVIQYYHRYGTVWPSIHPDTGQMYYWCDPDGVRVADGTVPGPLDFALLTEPWVEGLKKPVPKHRTGGNPYRWGTCAWERERLWRRQERQQQAATTGNTKTGGHASDKVAERLAQAIADLDDEGNRHDATRDHVLAIARFGEMGEPGTADALDDLCEAFVEAVTNDGSRTPAEATHEFTRLVAGAEDLIAADPSAHAIVNAVWPRRGRRREDGMDTNDQAGAEAGQEQDATKDAGEESSLLDRLARDGAWLDNQQFAPLEYAVPGIIPEGMGLLVAPPKKGKSWLVANIGLAVAAGGLASRSDQHHPAPGALPRAGGRAPQASESFPAHPRLRSAHPRRHRGDHRGHPGGGHGGDRRVHAQIRRREAAGHPRHARQGQAAQAARRRSPIWSTTRSAPRSRSWPTPCRVRPCSSCITPARPRPPTSSTRSAAPRASPARWTSCSCSPASATKTTPSSRSPGATSSRPSTRCTPTTECCGAWTAPTWTPRGRTSQQRRAEASLGDRQMDVYLTVAAADGPVTAIDVASQFEGMDNEAAGQYLRRLHASGYIHKISRGVFSLHPPVTTDEEQEAPPTGSSDSFTSVSEPEAVKESNTPADQEGNADSFTSFTSFTPSESTAESTAQNMVNEVTK